MVETMELCLQALLRLKGAVPAPPTLRMLYASHGLHTTVSSSTTRLGFKHNATGRFDHLWLSFWLYNPALQHLKRSPLSRFTCYFDAANAFRMAQSPVVLTC